MSCRRWIFFYGISIFVMLVAASCSQPAETTQNTKPSQTATAGAASKGSADLPRAQEQKPIKQAAKKEKTEPARSAAPRYSAPAAPAPVVTTPQTAADVPPPPPPVPVPAFVPQATPIPVPPPPPPPEPTTKQVTIPVGTELYVRMIDSISSDESHEGETFRAELDKPILVDNQTIIPRRADVFLKLVGLQSAGKLSGTSELKVQMDKIVIDKTPYNIVSNTYIRTGSPEGQKAARNVGLGAAVGGILGGILGGKKGAVIGAGAGGGGGAVISKGEQIHIDSETSLVFRLENPLAVTVTTTPASTSPPPSASTGGSGGPVKLAPPPERPSSRNSSSSNAGDLSGTWTVTTDGRQGTLQLVLRQNGNDLRGSISNPRGSGTLPIQGSVSGNYVTFSTQSLYGTNDTQMQYSGAVQGDNMQGTVTIPAANGGYGGVGGYPGGYPGGGYPGGGRRRSPRNGGVPAGGATTQIHWNAQRNN
jgi:hypothetical protein